MSVRDGNGWTRCGQGHRHWGRHGAAGLLVAAPDPGGVPVVLLQQRSGWGQHGGTWGPPGGARDSHESIVRAALREAAEECAITPSAVRVHGVLRDDHGGWTYQTVLGSAAEPIHAAAASDETCQVAWVPVADVGLLDLHPGFAEQWPTLREALVPLTIIVDAANVMGSRPDGWWRDRAGAATRLIDQLAGLATAGVSGTAMRGLAGSDGAGGAVGSDGAGGAAGSDGAGGAAGSGAAPGAAPVPAGPPVLERWYPTIVVVLEGAARSAAGDETGAPGSTVLSGAAADLVADGALRIVRAAGSGDDEIVRQAAELAGHRLVVTADRELRARCVAVGALVTGPGALLRQL